MPTMRTARGNRVGLGVLGVVLVAAGAAALAAGSGVLGASERRAHLLTGAEVHWVDGRGWFWPVVAAVVAVIALIALRWALVQSRRDGFGAVQLEADRRHGDTTVASRLLERAVCEEIGGYPGVARASALLAGAPSDPELHLTVGLREGADIAALRTRIDADAVVRLRSALEIDRLPLVLVLRLDVARAER